MLTGLVAFGASTVRGAVFARTGGAAIFRGSFCSDVLVSTAGTSANDCVVPGGHPFHQHHWLSRIGYIMDHVHWLSFGQLEMAPDSGRIPAVVCRRAHVLFASNRPAEAKFLSQDEKDWILAGASARGTRSWRAKASQQDRLVLNSRVWHLGSIGFTLNFGMYDELLMQVGVASKRAPPASTVHRNIRNQG